VNWFRLFFYSLVSLVVLALAGAAVFLVFYILPQSPHDNFAVININGISVIAEIVADDAGRIRGLGGRDKLADGAGMLFVFPRSGIHTFWMKDMKFPIDIFWIENNRVVDLVERAAAFPAGTPDEFLPVYRPDVPARFVFETPAGFAERHGIVIGASATITMPR
jgi:uncharacterized protein